MTQGTLLNISNECGEKRTLIHWLVEICTGAATMENSMEVPLKLQLSYDPAIPLLDTYPKKKKKARNTTLKRCVPSSAHSSIIYNF